MELKEMWYVLKKTGRSSKIRIQLKETDCSSKIRIQLK